MFIATFTDKKIPDKFQVGDIALSLHYVPFSDGTCHNKGERIVVTKETFAYFNVMQKEYEKVS